MIYKKYCYACKNYGPTDYDNCCLNCGREIEEEDEEIDGYEAGFLNDWGDS